MTPLLARGWSGGGTAYGGGKARQRQSVPPAAASSPGPAGLGQKISRDS